MAASETFQGRLGALWLRSRHVLAGVAVFMLVATVGNLVINLHTESMQARQNVELIAYGASLRARLESELSSVLYLTTGLSSYLNVRHRSLQRDEIEDILADLYQSSRHVRNLAIAVGYRVAYVHPLKGNEKAIGLHYPDQPAQWPMVKRAVDERRSVLIGPVDLVQGGRGLIYRLPVFVNDSYWGLLSTVIDTESLFKSAFAGFGAGNITYAVRGKDGLGMLGDVFMGDAGLFGQRDAQIFEFDVPGGKWAIATRFRDDPSDHVELWFLRALGVLFGLFLGWGTFLLLTQRAQLTRMALYDPLTGLPNRHLIEDRIAQTMSGQRRNRLTVSALLFVDLDGFKHINDQHGHRVGDVLLQGVARRVQAAVRATDTVGRWGGDEFIVLLENVDRRKIPELVESIRRAVQLPMEYATYTLMVGASIGIAIIPDDGKSVGDFVRAADAGMYSDKQKRNSGSLFG